MKKFYNGGMYFVMTSFSITAVPVLLGEEEDIGIAAAKRICDEACYLSASGSGETAIELLRISSDKGEAIEHIITLRTHDKSENGCVTRQSALEKGLRSFLTAAYYSFREITYEEYRRKEMRVNTESVWCLKKRPTEDYGMQGRHLSPPIVEAVDFSGIYGVMGSGSSICIQIIPSLLSANERRTIIENCSRTTQSTTGIGPIHGDTLAEPAANRWRYFAQNSALPFADVNVIVSGAFDDAALLAAELKHSAPLQAFPLHCYWDLPVYNNPWRVAQELRGKGEACFDKWTSQEAANILRFPVKSDYFIGVEDNPFSLAPQTDLLPSVLTNESGGIFIGKSAAFSKNVYLPMSELLIHAAIMGKSGVGKSTFMKQLIRQLNDRGVNILILEPVKREYRDLAAGLRDNKIFTVERPISPLLINPFCVPKGVALGDYKSSLLSAFKSAFSLPDPLPALFEKAISDTYTLYGWTDSSRSGDKNAKPFGMAEFISSFKRILDDSSYSGEVKGNIAAGGAFRLQSLLERCPYTFDTINSTSVEELLSGCSVLEMGTLEGEQKSLVSALTLISVSAYLKATRKSGNSLRNIILIDECHSLLDRGEGATQEEKSLNSTMTQLIINFITEIRAYGVGVIFADQSPSRIGSQMLDNVGNIISFRLSGGEAELLRTTVGEKENPNLCELLPRLSVGELMLSNRFVKSALPIRMEYRPEEEKHVEDEQIARSQAAYMSAHAADYRPFELCGAVGCDRCCASVREEAKMQSGKIFTAVSKGLREAQHVANCIMGIPAELSGGGKENLGKRCTCTAVHFLRKCYLEKGILINNNSVSMILNEMKKSGGI